MTRPKSRLRRYLPPIRFCRGCGVKTRSWTEAPLCGNCVQQIVNEPPQESMRDYRRRVLDPERNHGND